MSHRQRLLIKEVWNLDYIVVGIFCLLRTK